MGRHFHLKLPYFGSQCERHMLGPLSVLGMGCAQVIRESIPGELWADNEQNCNESFYCL